MTSKRTPTMSEADEALKFVIEILSCRNVLISDKTTSDPYVKVKLGKKDLHETKHILKTLNPVYGPETKNSFLLEASAHELEQGLFFKVKDWDRFGTNEELGHSKVSLSDLESMNGKEREFKLIPPEKRSKEDAGYISIRSHVSTDDDLGRPRGRKSGMGFLLFGGRSNPKTSNPPPSPAISQTTKDHTEINSKDSPTSSPRTEGSVPNFEKDALMVPKLVGSSLGSSLQNLSENSNRTTTVTVDDDQNKEAKALEKALGLSPGENARVRIEILSCRDLVIADRTSSGPYVVVFKGTEEIHRTKHALKTLNPVFSSTTKSSFRLELPLSDLIDSQGLEFCVKDSKDGDLGSLRLSPSLIGHVDGKEEYALQPPTTRKEKKNAGFITLICQVLNRRRVPNAPASPSRKTRTSSSDGGEVESVLELLGLGGVMTSPDQKGIAPPEEMMGPLTLLIQVHSCQELLIADNKTSDPYVKIMFDGKEVHRTKIVRETRNPVFGPETNFAFVLKVSGGELMAHKGLEFRVMDWNRMSRHKDLGQVRVPATKLLNFGEEGEEFDLKPPKGIEEKDAGSIVVFCRPATKTHLRKLAVVNRSYMSPMAFETSDDDSEFSEDSESMDLIDFSVPVEGAPGPADGERLNLIVEIIACRRILAGDRNGKSDPYVKVRMKGTIIHETSKVFKTLNPVFTHDTHSTFLLDCPAQDLFDADGLMFNIKDFDVIGANDPLGWVNVPAHSLYTYSEGEKMRFKIHPPKGREKEDAGFLYIRCRKATAKEKRQIFAKNKMRFSVIADETERDIRKEFDFDLPSDKDLYIEIVSCRELAIGDSATASSDPYVKVKLGDKVVHKTKYLTRTLNPVFTSKTKPAFILECPAEELFANGGLKFQVYDFDLVGYDDILGNITLPASLLYDFGGEAKEFKLRSPLGNANVDVGYITIKCHPANNEDRELLLKNKKTLFIPDIMRVLNNEELTERSNLSLLVEIVSCWGLIKADFAMSSDPFVKVKYGEKDVHKTKHIRNTVEPIFTIKTDSLFILDVWEKEFRQNELTFKVKDFDSLMYSDDLGSVSVLGEELCKASGERMVYKLKPPDGVRKKDVGYIAIRCRRATTYDLDFLRNVQKSAIEEIPGFGVLRNVTRNVTGGIMTGGRKRDDLLGVDEAQKKTLNTKGGAKIIPKIPERMTRIESEGPDKGVKKYRVRPEPDPARKQETRWMSKKQINEEALEPSQEWLDVGTGSLGRVFVEVIGADDLPNLDASLSSRDKTDAFVAMLYEDCVVKTDIIDDCLSPRWLPWTKRAFILNIDHTSSNLLIGVFDADNFNDELVGRFSVNLSNLRPSTEYLLHYKLHESSVATERSPRGTLTIRLRVEVDDQRALVLSNLRYPPEEYVNVRDKKDHLLVRKIIYGKDDLSKYSLKTLSAYIDELTGVVDHVQKPIYDAIISLIFWRGQVPIFGFYLPLHSLTLFAASVLLTERPSYYPSFFFFGQAWMLITMQGRRKNSPNAWEQTKSFKDVARMTMLGVGPHSIDEYHNRERVSVHLKECMERDKMEKEIKKKELELWNEHQKQLEEIGETTADTDIAKEEERFSLDPLKPYIFPLQQLLEQVVNGIRITQHVLTGDEPYISFVLSSSSIVLGVACLVIPWGFVCRWTTRILVWGLLGPHMKLVDVFYYSKTEALTNEEKEAKAKEVLKSQRETARAYADQARIQRENALKLKDMKSTLFGAYITRVPILNTERFLDIPLHKSYARPYEKEEEKSRAIVDRVPGQQLVMDSMIPMLNTVDARGAPPTLKEEHTEDSTTNESKKNV